MVKVHELLSSPDSWTKYVMARNNDYYTVQPNSTEAVRWCILGAIYHCYGGRTNDAGILAVIKISQTVGVISTWNDAPDRTYEDVRDLCLKLDI